MCVIVLCVGRKEVYRLFFSFLRNETCLITLSTGLAAHETKATGVICGSIVGGRIINQQGIKARFVRIEVDCYEFSLCEVQVYGILGKLLYLILHDPYSVFYNLQCKTQNYKSSFIKCLLTVKSNKYWWPPLWSIR